MTASNNVGANTELVGYADAAKLLNLPVGTLYSMVHERTIPHLRIGPRLVRFARAQLVDWLNERQVNVVTRRSSREGAR